MCGIFGAFSKNERIDLKLLDACRDTLTHRGPDMAGNFMDRGLYLGFRRLAILDLSAEGDQPMSSEKGRYTLIFNGEIYNYIELRSELERQGEVFRGKSDTEVLLRLYAQYGLQSLEKLNGMFAFGLYDKVERTLLLVRDRMGVKPLFYWQKGDCFAFASELRALRDLPGFPSSIDPEALGLYFRLGSVPEWTTIYPGVSKLPPSSWMRYHLDSGRVEGPVTYWDLPPVREESGKSEEEWVDEIEGLLWDSTRIRLRSDVPLGVFLSGGIDSGLVAVAAAKQMSGLTSLTIGFVGEAEDETSLALATARHLGLHAITRNIDLREGLAQLPQIMGHFDEPFSDTSALPTSLVCAEARKEFTVVLSGDAGDEVFGGYDNHVRAWQWRGMDRFPLGMRYSMGSLFAFLSPSDSLPKRFFRRMGQPVGQFGLGGMLYPFQDWLDSCIKPELNLNPERIVELYDKNLQKWSDASSIDLAQRTDLRVYMLEDILIKVDRMSMMNSLEVRSPFLDYRLVELGLRIPSHLRVKYGQNKYLLRRLAARYLPQSVCSAPKRGFGIPVHSWLNAESSSHLLAATLAKGSKEHIEPFIKGGAERLWLFSQKNSALTSAVIQLLCYRWWCQKH
jgi:asparagine synthase (glutamine-hydrolysing)